jgi:hypothetical protein
LHNAASVDVTCGGKTTRDIVPANVLLPLAAFLAMGLVVLLALWRIVVVGGEARRAAQSYRTASDVAHRADGCIADVAATIDDLRRRRLEPDAAASPLAEATATLAAYAAEVRTGMGREGAVAFLALADELDRAQRSLELVEHGRQLLASREDLGEGETSIKRGYLNLLHARDAIGQRGAEIRASAPGAAPRTAERR